MRSISAELDRFFRSWFSALSCCRSSASWAELDANCWCWWYRAEAGNQAATMTTDTTAAPMTSSRFRRALAACRRAVRLGGATGAEERPERPGPAERAEPPADEPDLPDEEGAAGAVLALPTGSTTTGSTTTAATTTAPTGQGVGTAEGGGAAQVLFDPEELVVLGHPVRPAGSTGLDLPGVGGHGQVGDGGVLGLAGPVGDHRPVGRTGGQLDGVEGLG